MFIHIYCYHMDCKPNFNYVFDKWMTISSIVFIPGHRFLEGVWHNISTTRPQVVKIHTNNRWYLCHRHERVNHSKEFKNGEHSKMKTWWCLLCWYRIMIDLNTNNFTSNRRNVFKYWQIVALQNVLSQMFCAANGFHQNNAENVHSVAKRDARHVQYMVLYCNVLYIVFCIGNCLVASCHLSVLTVFQSS